ncbi:anthrone oxygenase family protein [Streptomyces sp. SP17BM10]|uniref:anthrone oxygenase family protein n=1 Tax=Streptomyces sp. SP17BM10 TaxID=3002530 RepID=UPI002E77379F|nr:DUF1772 domain-containing protein [Streptomyces sp. SP17BM10]
MAATITYGLTAGLFYASSCSVMPALRRVDDRTFIDVMQKVDVAILNGWFVLGYLGALLFGAAAVALHLPEEGRDALPATIAALVLYAGNIGVTRAVNIPLNDELGKAGSPELIAGPAAVRRAFEERGVRFNGAAGGAVHGRAGFLAWALVLDGNA